jgi:hypothetical protein
MTRAMPLHLSATSRAVYLSPRACPSQPTLRFALPRDALRRRFQDSRKTLKSIVSAEGQQGIRPFLQLCKRFPVVLSVAAFLQCWCR